MVFRPRSLLVLLVVLAALVPAAPAAAKTVPGSPPFRVVIVAHLDGTQLRSLAARGAAFGLLVPGAGPTTNFRQALAQLVRGAQMNARLGGVPSGPRLISTNIVTGTPTGSGTIVIEMPPKGPPRPNDRRYLMVVLGGGFHGLLDSPTTRIQGLVSIVDIAPTALGHKRGSLHSTATANPLASLTSLDRQIHANNRLKLPALIVVACIIALLAAVRPRAATTAIPAALLVSIALGAAQVTSEPLILGVLIAGTLGLGLLFARLCPTDGRLLGLIVAVLVLHLVLLARRPEWVALTPLGPTQNSRFWGIGNQLETLLLAPILVGAALAARRFGRIGFATFVLLGLVLVTDNRFGSDGGGAIVFGVAFAFLGARVLRLGVRGFVTLLLLGATVVLGLVSLNLRAGGPDHLRSAFAHGLSGLFAVLKNRVPLAYVPAIDNWPLVLPLAIWFVVALAIAIKLARRRATRDLVLAVGLAIGTSLLVNDSATYELVGGVATLAALVRFTPAVGPLTVPALARLPLQGQPVPNEATD
ncbi:MAG TPA: hypothetical protein VGN27_04780 [Gaiellaceae bacterium]|jgi:hypothetical protein|nr:hypothetical protein [Gaiellaceae bacterium]